MPAYIFRLFNCQGDAPTFEIHEAAHDGLTYLRASQLLRQYAGCDHVEVWDHDRPVLSRHREEPLVRAVRGSGGGV